MSGERLSYSQEYKLPNIEVAPERQVFEFKGFVIVNNQLYFDIKYDGIDRSRGMILRSAINDSYTYSCEAAGYEYREREKPIEYNRKLYDKRQTDIVLLYKHVCLEQLSIFADLVNEIIKQKGLDSLTQKDIFGDENVRAILGLDNEDTFEYTPLFLSRAQAKTDILPKKLSEASNKLKTVNRHNHKMSPDKELEHA